ncbi:MAG: DUF1499 domain-containing protein [SAR324 cluster bacterium]|nr:DUF1499 domain-containing protein [SAR324 cluster bacterium]
MAENNYDLTSLKACPDKPNCVSTVEKHLPALKIQGDLAFVHSAIEKALKTFSNYKIVKQTNNYFHIEFTSSFFQFTDDLELLIVEREGLIHCRSASRIGWSDLGVNKNRVKKLFAAIQAQSPR